MCAQRRIDTDDLRICLTIRQTWVAVEGITANTGRMPLALEPIEQLLDARFMGEGGIRVWLFRRRFGWVFPAQPMNIIEFFGSLVIGLKGVILQRPCRRNTVRMPDFIKIPLTEPQQNGTVDLAVAAHEIMKSGMKALAVGAIPSLRCLIARVHEHRLAVPILAFAWQVATPLQNEDAFAGLRQAPGHG